MTDSTGKTGSPPMCHKHQKLFCVECEKEVFARVRAQHHSDYLDGKPPLTASEQQPAKALRVKSRFCTNCAALLPNNTTSVQCAKCAMLPPKPGQPVKHKPIIGVTEPACPKCKQLFHHGNCKTIVCKNCGQAVGTEEHRCPIRTPKPVSSRQCCRLCSCKGVQGTVLCKDHLEGFEYACHYLAYKGNGPLAQLLMQTIEQGKADDNG